MPELPDITIYIEALEARLIGQPLEKIRLGNPFLLRSFEPPVRAAEGKKIVAFQRIGKRIVVELEGDLFLVFHLMITGRFHWKKRGFAIPRKYGHAAFDFPAATLLLTEMGTKKRASLHLIKGRENLIDHDPGGLEIFAADLNAFRTALTRENHTLKRTLTDPHLFSGIGNAYSDEILHRARLSPVKQNKQLSDSEIETLFHATKDCLREWIERLRKETGKDFPERITAFRDEMAVHGKYRKPCPVCGAPVQRIVYADNETNYCAKCQTGGKLLADRSLSRLLKDDWPRSLDELEELRTPKMN
ncbi:MAG TPA: DNA-formamidopyrimidine glycosylase family protein [Candidatus Binatia bacterium]